MSILYTGWCYVILGVIWKHAGRAVVGKCENWSVCGVLGTARLHQETSTVYYQLDTQSQINVTAVLHSLAIFKIALEMIFFDAHMRENIGVWGREYWSPPSSGTSCLICQYSISGTLQDRLLGRSCFYALHV